MTKESLLAKGYIVVDFKHDNIEYLAKFIPEYNMIYYYLWEKHHKVIVNPDEPRKVHLREIELLTKMKEQLGL